MFSRRKEIEVTAIILGSFLFLLSFIMNENIGFFYKEIIRILTVFSIGFFLCQILWKRKLDLFFSYTKMMEEKQYEKKLDKIKENSLIANISNTALDLFKESKQAYQGTLKTSVEVACAMEELNNIMQDMEVAADQIASTTDDLAEGSIEQLNALNTMLEAFRYVGSYLDSIKSASESTVKEAESSYDSSKNGKLYIEETIRTMDKISCFSQDLKEVVLELGEKIEKINEFVVIITSIADHTKLLALNSSIEAARAGEHGKGFAVVADEVGNLAYQSQNASNDIIKILQEITTKLDELKEYVEENAKKVDDGKSTVEKTNDVLQLLETSAQQTRNSIKKIRDNLDEIQDKNANIYESTNNIQTISETNAASSEELNAMLQEMSASFKKIATNTEGVTELSRELQESVAASAMERYMYHKALKIRNKIENETYAASQLKDLANECYISDIYIVGKDGEIINASEEKAIGLNSFNIDHISKDASKTKEKYLATPIRRRVEDNQMYKFLHLPYKDGKVLTVSLSLGVLLNL